MNDDIQSRRRCFLEPEKRDGYFVDAKMKSLWKVQMDIIEEFLRICKKHNLKCFGIAGTLLGAVRHKGYIPWDDDVDFALPRKDYDVFCKAAKKELKSPYFLQNFETDEFFHEGFSKIRNPDTTMITKWSRDHRIICNQGICIDVFPLDCVSDRKTMQRRIRIDYLMRRLRGMTKLPKTSNPFRFTLWFGSWMIRRILGNALISRIRESVFRLYNNKDAKYVGLLSFRLGDERFWWERSCFDRAIEVPYEYITIPIPAEYDKILSVQYGDWRKPVRGASQHSEILFDADRPYTFYLKQWGYIK